MRTVVPTRAATAVMRAAFSNATFVADVQSNVREFERHVRVDTFGGESLQQAAVLIRDGTRFLGIADALAKQGRSNRKTACVGGPRNREELGDRSPPRRNAALLSACRSA